VELCPPTGRVQNCRLANQRIRHRRGRAGRDALRTRINAGRRGSAATTSAAPEGSGGGIGNGNTPSTRLGRGWKGSPVAGMRRSEDNSPHPPSQFLGAVEHEQDGIMLWHQPHLAVHCCWQFRGFRCSRQESAVAAVHAAYSRKDSKCDAVLRASLVESGLGPC
jgi:hypothetical protein